MSRTSIVRDRFREFPLDGGLLLFHPPTGTNIRLRGAPVRNFRRSAPRVVMFGITNACNLSCEFCSRDVASRSLWSVDSAFAVLEGMARAGTLEVAFGGGEPFVFPGFAALLRRLHAETALALHVTTNGALIREDSWREYAGLLGQVRVSIYDDHVWRRCASVFRSYGQRWGANLLVDDAALDGLSELLGELARAGCDDVSLLGYVGEPGRVLSASGRERLAQIVAASAAVCRVSVCFGGELAVPRLMAGFDNTGDCGAGSDFISILPDQRVQSCSFQDVSWPATTAAEILSLWRSKRVALGGASVRSGCSRASGSAWAIDPLPEIAVWQGFSGNNSGECVLVGRFPEAEKAEAFLDELLPGWEAISVDGPNYAHSYPRAWLDLFTREGVNGASMAGSEREVPGDLVVIGKSVLAVGYGVGDNFPELRAFAWKRGAFVMPGGVDVHGDPTLFVAMNTRDRADMEAKMLTVSELGMSCFEHGRVLYTHAPCDSESGLGRLAAELKTITGGEAISAEIHCAKWTPADLMAARQRLGNTRPTQSRLWVHFRQFSRAVAAAAVDSFARVLDEQSVQRGSNWLMLDPVHGRKRVAVLAYRRDASVVALDAETVRVSAYLWRERPPRTRGTKAHVLPMPSAAEVASALGSRDPAFHRAEVVSCDDHNKAVTASVLTQAPGRIMQWFESYASDADLEAWLSVEEPRALDGLLCRLRADLSA